MEEETFRRAICYVEYFWLLMLCLYVLYISRGVISLMLLDMSLQSTTRRAWYEPFSSKHKQPPPSELKDWPNSEFEWHRLKQYGCNNNFADFP